MNSELFFCRYAIFLAINIKNTNSDIDLLVTICQPLTEAQRATLMQELLALSSPPGASAEKRALEVTVVLYSQLVPWCFPPSREMQFGEWLREDICQGIYEPAQQDWDMVLLITQILETSIPLKGIWYTLSPGRFTSKDAAADWLLPQLPEDYAATLRAAQREYLGLEQQDWHILLPAVVRFVDFAKAHIPTQFT